MIGLLGCERTLIGYVELWVNQHPKVLLSKAALSPFSTQPVFILEITPTLVQDLAHGLAEFHEVHRGPPLKHVRVPLDGICSFQHVNRTTQFGVIFKLAKGELSPTVHVTNKDVKQPRSQYQSQRNVTCHLFPLGHRAIDCNSSSVTIQSNPNVPSIKFMSLQFRDKNVMWDSVKCFA